jgi:hypothetical protein
VKIIVKKDNQTFGPYTREEVLEFIEVEELSLEDLGSLEGEENWNSLTELLSISNDSEKDSSIYDQFEDDDVDYEKMKEWEDVFQDEDEGGEDEDFSEQDENREGTNNSIPPPIDTLESPVASDSSTSAPPPFESKQFVEGEPITSYPPRVEEQSDGQSPAPQEYTPPPPPSLPLPPPPKTSPASSKREDKEKSVSRGGRDRISSSHKIRGLNNKQTVIVVKGEGVLSKIYSISLVFIILFVVIIILGFAGLIFAPDRVAPILQKIGVPSEVIEELKSPSVPSKK